MLVPKFVKGQGGRPKGSKNKTSREIREAILAACENLGLDLHGWGGTTGFFMRVGMTSPNTLANIASKLLPMKIEEQVHTGVDLSKYTAEELVTLHRLLAKGEIALLQDPRKAFDDVDRQLSPQNKHYQDLVRDLTNAAKQ